MTLDDKEDLHQVLFNICKNKDLVHNNEHLIRLKIWLELKQLEQIRQQLIILINVLKVQKHTIIQLMQ